MSEKSSGGAAATTVDEWLGGRLSLRQPRSGHRVGSDAALLAAAAPVARRIADVGAGVGAVGLAIALRLPKARIDLIEIDPALSALARENAAANGVGARARIVTADAMSATARRAAGLTDGEADLVVTNPPFFDAAAVRASPDPRRARAHVLPGPDDAGQSALARWLKSSLALVAPGGRFAMIHRPDALGVILAALEGHLGAVAILPIYPRANASAHRLLIAGIKGARAPLSIRSGLVLHDAAGAFTPAAEALHRGEATIDWDRPSPREAWRRSDERR
jgi:tRNA1(Val) A37 N6-methylase TrmN6